MIHVNDNDYVLCVWGVGRDDVDILGVTLRPEGERWFTTLVRFGYGAGDSASLHDRKNWVTGRHHGQGEGQVGGSAYELFRSVRRRGGTAAFRFVRGGPAAFMRTLATMPMTVLVGSPQR